KKRFEVIENHLTRTKDWVDNTNEENLTFVLRVFRED
ncbi:hypothetical protein MGSAQ_002070, partial [marine sediment metagenome]